MRIPHNFQVVTSDLINVQNKFTLLCATLGCRTIDKMMDSFVLRVYRTNNRHAGKYLTGKVCEEFQITEYELFESKARKELTDARKVYCAVAYEVFDLTQDQIGKAFGNNRHLVHRAVKEITEAATNPQPFPYQKMLLDKYNRILFRMKAYLTFKAKGTDVTNDKTTEK